MVVPTADLENQRTCRPERRTKLGLTWDGVDLWGAEIILRIR
jgi:hypothetical protein